MQAAPPRALPASTRRLAWPRRRHRSPAASALSCVPLHSHPLSRGCVTRVCRAAFIKSKMLENEAELMKDVPNWEAGASVYKTRYMSPMEVFGVR